MADIVEVPLTVVQAIVEVPLRQTLPTILREEGLGSTDAKVSDLTELLPQNVQQTDMLLVTRDGVFSRRMPISTMLGMVDRPDQGETSLDPVNDGGNNIHLTQFPAYVDAQGGLVDTLNVWMPTPLRHGQEAEVYFACRVNNLVMRVTGTDGGITITKSTKGLPAFILPGTTLKFRYNRHDSDPNSFWVDCQWHVALVSAHEDPAGVTNPVREFGVKADGSTLVTTLMQTAADAARDLGAPPTGLVYGQGRTLALPPSSVFKMGKIDLSRRVSVAGLADTLNAAVVRCDYTELLGVVGEDGAFQMADDGFQQASLVGQQVFRNFGIDGKYGNEPGHGVFDGNRNELNHKRHAFWFKPVANGHTDRACALYDQHVSNMPGSGWRVDGNDQVHGSDFKLLNCERGIDFSNVSDGKLTNFGLGGNRKGNRAVNSASLKQRGVDAWTDQNFDGIAGQNFLWEFISCAKCTAADGEWEGPIIYTGDNHRSYGNGNDGSVADSKSAFQISQNEMNGINQKVSTDYYTGTGSVRPFAHVTIKDTDLLVRASSWGFKLGFAPSTLEQNATPMYLFGFDTQMLPGNPNYAQALRNCGSVNIDRSCKLLWHFPKMAANGSLVGTPIYPFYGHVSNMPWKCIGIVVGVPYLGLAGHLADDEIELNGQTLNNGLDGLLYLFTEPGGTWNRRLFDRGGGGSLDYINFQIPNMNPGGIPVGVGVVSPPLTWRTKRWQ